MCGIAGVMHFADPSRPVDSAVLERMTRSLAHRGPDGQGLWIAPTGGVGLGHRRLRILDLSERGRQPMLRYGGELAITFNGEIYNFRELRTELEALGERFESESDTEVLLAGYRHWGEGLLERISGIYAFAIYDARESLLFLARDPLGVKPLFYSTWGHSFRFGSEIKAILSDPAVPRDLDPEAVDAFLTFSYTPAPLTGLRHVGQLLPGHCAVVDRRGCRARRNWDPPYAAQPHVRDFESARKEFTRLLDRVTRAQLISDVPVGAFLSGGLDSAAIVRAIRRASSSMERTGGARVTALTVGFDEAGFDERVAARRTATSLGVPLEEQIVSVDAAELLPRISHHVEEPTADSSMVPVFCLCRAAREHFTVALSGDGADEILAGYDTYRATALARRYRRLPRGARRWLLSGLARCLPVSDAKYGLRQVIHRFVTGAEMGPGRDHCAWRICLSNELKHRVYAGAFGAAAARHDPLGRYAAHLEDVPADRSLLSRLLHADTAFYLPNDMLVKVDRMSMAHGLEVRVPFLDIEMVRFAAALPDDFKLHRGRVRKHILRESLRGDIPDSVLDQPKSGFNAPLQAWMRGPLGDLLIDALRSRRDAAEAFVRVDAVEGLLREHRQRRADHAHALFAILMLALWLDNVATAWHAPRQTASAPAALETV